jgi:hypothetical protein
MVTLATFGMKKQNLADAYALIRMADPALTETRWIAHAEGLIDAGGGVIGAAASGGPLLGLASYRTESDLRRGRVLRVDPIMACELGSGAPVRRALIDALTQLAKGLDCDALLVPGPCACIAGDGARRLAAWQQLGLVAESVSLCRTLR